MRAKETQFLCTKCRYTEGPLNRIKQENGKSHIHKSYITAFLTHWGTHWYQLYLYIINQGEAVYIATASTL